MANELISIRQAAKRGVSRLRKPNWANPMDHIKIDIINDAPGPWVHLFCPFNIECSGHDPVDMLFTAFDYDLAEFEPYTGALPDSDEYKEMQAKFAGCMGEKP